MPRCNNSASLYYSIHGSYLLTVAQEDLCALHDVCMRDSREVRVPEMEHFRIVLSLPNTAEKQLKKVNSD